MKKLFSWLVIAVTQLKNPLSLNLVVLWLLHLRTLLNVILRQGKILDQVQSLWLPRNFISHPMITATEDRTKLSNPQVMMNASAILVLGWFCINKKNLLLTYF